MKVKVKKNEACIVFSSTESQLYIPDVDDKDNDTPAHILLAVGLSIALQDDAFQQEVFDLLYEKIDEMEAQEE